MPQASNQDRQEVMELLNELRVVLPGVQVLFAFLLTVPFTQRFAELGRTERGVYFSALLFAAASSALLIAPSIHARLTWQRLDRRWVVELSNHLAIWGSVLLAAGMACAVYLIADLLYRSGIAALFTAAVVLVMVGTWYVVPLVVRLSRNRAR